MKKQSLLFWLMLPLAAMASSIRVNEPNITAWRGERIGIEADIQMQAFNEPVSLRLTAMDKVAGQWETEVGFLGWILTDSLNVCDRRSDVVLKPFSVPDIICGPNARIVEDSIVIQPREDGWTPAWCTLEVPRSCRKGLYRWRLEAVGNQSHRVLSRCELKVNVIGRSLPTPHDQHFHVDYWQQPYAVSRHHDVPRWSQKHFDLLRPYLQLLARGGQKVVTTILFYEPWGKQSNDKFDAMVKTTRRKDGSWSYDYTVFDHYVELCDSCGINKQINCFSMVPWDMTFRYYDELAQQDINLKTTTDSPTYKELWTAFLKSFAQHLREKGWYEKTCIAMDERDVKAMLDAWNVVQEAVPGMKMALAGHHHPELVEKVYDYCLGYRDRYTADELAWRRKQGMVSTIYICCSTKIPNTFTNSQPAEAVYIPLNAVANNFDGYLHWSWMNWPDNPLHDSRFKMFPAGDTHLIHPGPCSSPRWERFIEGVQLAEKVRILREEYTQNGNTTELQRLNAALNTFAPQFPGTMSELTEKIANLKILVNR